MERSLFLNLTGEMPLFKIIDFLVENKSMDFSKKDIAEGADISRASLFNYWKELEKHNIVRLTRQFGKTKLYTLNSQSLIVKKILELEKALIEEAMDKENRIVDYKTGSRPYAVVSEKKEKYEKQNGTLH